MISQNKRKIFRQLQQKKQRDALGLFVAEGRKTVGDLLRGGLACSYIAGTEERIAELGLATAGIETVTATEDEIAEVSALQTRSEIIAIFRKPELANFTPQPNSLILALDEVQDPGNMGTIVRTADWFGIETIVCSPHCADAYGPKAVQASMGALARVRVVSTDLQRLLERNAKEWQLPVIGTFLEGDNLYQTNLPAGGFLLMGNEGHGIDAKLQNLVSHKILIPNFPQGRPTSESLNVSIATAVVVSELRRRAF